MGLLWPPPQSPGLCARPPPNRPPGLVVFFAFARNDPRGRRDESRMVEPSPPPTLPKSSSAAPPPSRRPCGRLPRFSPTQKLSKSCSTPTAESRSTGSARACTSRTPAWAPPRPSGCRASSPAEWGSSSAPPPPRSPLNFRHPSPRLESPPGRASCATNARDWPTHSSWSPPRQLPLAGCFDRERTIAMTLHRRPEAGLHMKPKRFVGHGR